MTILEINGLKKSFGNLTVLKEISLKVNEGQVVAIIGPSGSGKSTLLRCATTLEEADGGEIKYFDDYLMKTGADGKTLYAGKNELKKIRSYFGLVFQNFNLFPHFSVLRNITEAPIKVQGMARGDAEARAYELLNQMGLADKAASYPCELSGGQQQRVGIARALALKPAILFFDEPTSALDPELTGEILKVIRELASQKMTMVIVTHEMSFARDVADYIIFMDGGVIEEQGTPEEVFSNTKSERTKAFIGKIEGR